MLGVSLNVEHGTRRRPIRSTAPHDADARRNPRAISDLVAGSDLRGRDAYIGGESARLRRETLSRTCSGDPGVVRRSAGGTASDSPGGQLPALRHGWTLLPSRTRLRESWQCMGSEVPSRGLGVCRHAGGGTCSYHRRPSQKEELALLNVLAEGRSPSGPTVESYPLP